MDEQKRLILAVVLSVVVLVVYQWLFVKPPDPNQIPQPVENQTQQKKTASEAAKVKSNVSEYKVDESTAKPSPSEIPVKKEFKTITVSTPLYELTVSENGAAVVSMSLKKYKETNKEDSPLKQLVSDKLPSGTLLFNLEENSIPGLKDAVYTAQMEGTRTEIKTGEKAIEFVFTAPNGIVAKKIYTFKADTYTIGCDIVIQNGADTPINDSLIITTPGLFDEAIKKKSRFAFQGPIGLIDDDYTAIKPKKIEEKPVYTGKIDWSGFTQRYFMTIVMPDPDRGNMPKETKLKLAYANDIISASFVEKMDRLDPGTQARYAYTVYMGPKSLKIVSELDSKLKEAINFGFFNILAKPLLMGMNYIHAVIPNYGVAIILLTVLIKLIFWPLGTKSYKSMNDMKKVQPLMMELREKYKDDKQRMNKEIMGLYKTYKVNPASGCLPMAVQMPIFFALYRMLYQAIELRHAHFFGWVTDLSAPDRLFHFNFAIPMMQEPYGIPALTLIMGASFFLQQKMTPTAGDPTQAKMMMLMPIFMTVLFINFPAGLVLYMFANNIISMGQQYYIQKKFS